MVIMMMKVYPSKALWKYIIGAVALLGIGSGAYLWSKNRKKELNKNDITN